MSTLLVDDPETLASLRRMEENESIHRHRLTGVRSVLVILSSAAMVYDVDALRQKITAAYPNASVFFWTTSGHAYGDHPPSKLDLIIDFSPPGVRQGLFFSRKVRRRGKTVVGRNAGLFRKSSYDMIYDERSKQVTVPQDRFHRERWVQKEVLALAGVSMVETGNPTVDLAKVIALELPPLAHST